MGYLRFLSAVLLVQAVTALLVITALGGDWRTTWPLFAAVGVAVGALGAFWVSAIGVADRRAALHSLGEKFARQREELAERLAREREDLRVKAERRRAEDLRIQERLAEKARRGGALGPTMRAGLTAGGVLGAGVALIFAQFLTLGLAVVAGVGGAAFGYAVRRRQERLVAGLRGEPTALPDTPSEKPRPLKLVKPVTGRE